MAIAIAMAMAVAMTMAVVLATWTVDMIRNFEETECLQEMTRDRYVP